MRFDPSLIIHRFRVERRGHVAYDELFHTGVNIIRGANSSGKSTILNLLFFALGGDLKDWSETALLCTRVLVQVELSGRVATLSREISDTRGQPMDIFSGTMEEALSASVDRWERYPYSRRDQTASFSEILFSIFKLPEVTTEAAANVTMNQVLRLLYADQLSPVDNIFKFEQFDPPALRDAVGRMLCGAFESEVYSNTIKIRDSEKQLDQIVGELRSFYAILGRADQASPMLLLVGERDNLELQRDELRLAIQRLEAAIATGDSKDDASLAAQSSAYRTLQTVQGELAELQTERDSLALEIADSNSFIADLGRKRQALDDAKVITDEIEQVRFEFCPSCYAPTGDIVALHACHLCKTPFDEEKAKVRVVALMSDIDTQLKQSNTLQKKRIIRLDQVQTDLEAAGNRWQTAAQTFNEVQRSPSSEVRQEVNALQRQLGYVERQIEDLGGKLRVAEIVQQLTAKKDEISGSIATLRSRNETLQRIQQVNLSNAFSAVAEEIKSLLRRDISRQDSFENPENVQFDFSTNKITVDDHTYFSASSRVLLRNSFFVGFLTAAANNRMFRHPRFLMLDSIEDKGMEVERSHNFQRMIVQNVEGAASESQVIFGTSMIAPDLEEDRYVVGRSSTRDERTLAIG